MATVPLPRHQGFGFFLVLLTLNRGRAAGVNPFYLSLYKPEAFASLTDQREDSPLHPSACVGAYVLPA